eukprot:2165814-Pyramimonas_sp.AAC.1
MSDEDVMVCQCVPTQGESHSPPRGVCLAFTFQILDATDPSYGMADPLSAHVTCVEIKVGLNYMHVSANAAIPPPLVAPASR